MGKLITHEQFEKRRETKPLPLVSYNEKQSAEILPFSKNIILRYQRNRRGKLRLQIAELRKTLIAIGLPTNEEFMLFVICYWSDQQEIQSLAKSDQYRHLKKHLIQRGKSIMPKYRQFAAAMGKLGICLPNFSLGLLLQEEKQAQAPGDPPDEIA